MGAYGLQTHIWSNNWKTVLLMEFGDFAMLRRMLRGIKARADSGRKVQPGNQDVRSKA